MERKEIYKDRRKLNTRENRICNTIDKRKYQSKIINKFSKKCHEVRMFVVEKRDAATLIPIIKANVLEGSDITSDEWRAYNSLNKHGYNHYKVNHSENFVNPKNGKHTQLIECLWNVAKYTIIKRSRGASHKHLPTHLAEEWYRSIHQKDYHQIFCSIFSLLKN